MQTLAMAHEHQPVKYSAFCAPVLTVVPIASLPFVKVTGGPGITVAADTMQAARASVGQDRVREVSAMMRS